MTPKPIIRETLPTVKQDGRETDARLLRDALKILSRIPPFPNPNPIPNNTNATHT